MLDQEIHIRDYLKVLRKRRGIVFSFLSLTFFFVLIGTFAATPIYKSMAEVLIEKEEINKLSSNSPYGSRDPEFNETQIQLIKSYNVIRRVVKSLKLNSEYKESFFHTSLTQKFIQQKKEDFFRPIKNFFSNIFDKISPRTIITNSFDQPKVDDTGIPLGGGHEINETDLIITNIMKTITVTPVRDSRIIQISFEHQNPIIAQLVTNEIAKAYKNEILEIKMTNSSYTVKWMSEKAIEEREKLEESERSLQKYMEDTNILTIEDKVAILPEKLKELSNKLSQAQVKRNELEIIVQKFRAGKETDRDSLPPGISSNSYYQSILTKLLTAEQLRQELAKKYGPKHPKMVQAIEEIAILEKGKAKEIETQKLSIADNYELVKSEVRNLEEMIRKTKDEAQTLNKNFIEYRILKRDVETNRVMYESLISQVKEKKVSEETSNINVWVTEAAKIPIHPDSPKKGLNMMLGIILGLFGGIGLAFFVEYLDDTVSAEEVESKTGLALLGVLELVRDKNNKPDSSNFLDTDEGFSAYSEGMKSIRTSILLSSAETPPKIILTTSTAPGEGKTTTNVNLSKVFAMAGYKVLLIDVDLRKPRIHKLFNLDNSKGLSSYLAGIDDSEFFHDLSGFDNLSVVTAGPIPPNPSELLVSNRFDKLLKKLENKFDFIFLDTAPVFSATETMFLCKHYRPILVVNSGETTYSMLRDANIMFKASNISPLGIILNRVDRIHAKYSYTPYKYYGYYTSSNKS